MVRAVPARENQRMARRGRADSRAGDFQNHGPGDDFFRRPPRWCQRPPAVRHLDEAVPFYVAGTVTILPDGTASIQITDGS